MSVPSDQGIMRTMIKSHFEKDLCFEGPITAELMSILEEDIKKPEVTSLYVKVFLCCLLPEKVEAFELEEGTLKNMQNCLESIDRSQIKALRNVEEMFGFVLEFWSKTIFSNEEQFKELINLLISTQKGLTKSELLSVTRMDSEELKVFTTIFKPFLMNFNGLWMIKNDTFKESILHLYDFTSIQMN